MKIMSLPSRERGLKSSHTIRKVSKTPVAPLAGAWIEIFATSFCCFPFNVAPLAGAWIEII